MPGIKPSIKLAKLHDAFNKHAPTIEVCCVAFKGEAFKQFACSCGHVFWDTSRFLDIQELSKTPTTGWNRCLHKAYAATALYKAFKSYWLGYQRAHVLQLDVPNRAFGLPEPRKPKPAAVK
jgi:hypothetical protein